MRLQSIYKSDINRDINGVIKVAQDDEQSIVQELSEYIITRELRRHFNTFLNHYERSLEQPTDKIGVWISGFFGSGKSHFLKMLSYLLANKTVGGKKAVQYFSDKFDDPMMFAQLENCVKVPTETILFNIDSKSPLTKDKTAILRVFAKVFYEHQGFYGNDLKVAKLEQFIAKSGKTEQFRECFERINGGTWEESRDSFAFFEDDIVEAMSEALDMSETAARNWFNGEEEIELSIEQLVKEIREYIDSKGRDYRLMFMIDEVGQYIGSDSDLMLNLQTIVEEIGTKCGGRVWVMVTSQEAIDSITKISGDDFSKIQGRFNTRLSLSSSSVDEVIKKRILAKTDTAEQVLSLQYEKNNQVLKNLFTFNNAVLDLKGYSGEGEFIETYPFVPYQFRLMQNVLAEIRKHGNSGKHLSGGERSMLSGFQEAAQAIQDRDEYALVPFYLFYDTVHTFLESSIRRVIDRCQNAADNRDGIEQTDVNILKLLYLVRYVDDVKANIDNISILMADDIRTDKVSTRLSIQQSLDRLVSQNYVSRAGDTYTFLTDDEQDIAREIKNTPVDSAIITKAISDIIFGKLFVSKKFKYGKYDFPYDQRIDETVIGQLTGSVALHFITVASEIYTTDDSVFLMRSAADNEVIVVLAESQPYFKELEDAMKIRRYVKSKNVAQLPEMIQSIIRGRQNQASAHEKRAEELISAAIAEGRVYVAGDKLTLKVSSVKERIERAMSILVESVYTKLSYVRKNYDSDADILQILSGDKQMMLDGAESPNAEAVKELYQYLDIQKMKQLPTSMGDIQKRYQAIPYGWREIDIAGVTAELIASQKLTLKYGGAVIQPSDKKMPDYLRKRTEIDKAIIGFRNHFAGYEEQYVLIGGAACDIVFESNDASFRATRDLDMVLIVEALTPEFGEKLWEFIEIGRYRNKATNGQKPQFYRFDKPEDDTYPKMIELFCRNDFELREMTGITPIHIDDSVSSLSAILLDDEYYKALMDGRVVRNGLSVLRPEYLILFKAKAYIDLKQRKDNGESVDYSDIKKHKKDILRIAAELVLASISELPATVKADIDAFIGTLEQEPFDSNSLKSYGLKNDDVIEVLHRIFG